MRRRGRRGSAADLWAQCRICVADLRVIERNGDICIDFANIGSVSGDGGGGKKGEDERGGDGGDMKISMELTTLGSRVRALPRKCHVSRSRGVRAATRGDR